MHNTHASPTTLRVADDVESTIPGPATSSSNRYHHPLPEDYDDQVALLYMRIQELKQLFEDFVEAQEKMKVFRDLKDPFGRLVVSPNVVRVTLDEFCNAVKDLEPQITETFEQHPASRTARLPVHSMRSHYVNGEKSESPSKPVSHRIVESGKIPHIPDDSKPFEFKVSEIGCALYPITIKWHPTAPMPDTQAIPAGMRLEVNPNSHIVISDLPPLIDPPRTSVDSNITQWLDRVTPAPEPTTGSPSKGKKRAREEDVDPDPDSRPRSPHRVRTAIKNLELDALGIQKPTPLRRSMRIKTGKNAKAGSGLERPQVVEESDTNAGGSKSRGRSRMFKKRIYI